MQDITNVTVRFQDYMTQDCCHDSFSVETLCSQKERAVSVAKRRSP